MISVSSFFLRFRFGDRKEILRDRLEEFDRPFSIDVISGHYILRDRWRNLRDRFGPSKHFKKNTVRDSCWQHHCNEDISLESNDNCSPSEQQKLPKLIKRSIF